MAYRLIELSDSRDFSADLYVYKHAEANSAILNLAKRFLL